MTPEGFIILLEKYVHQELTEEESIQFLEAAALPEYQVLLEAAVDESFRDGSIRGLSSPGQAEHALERFRSIIHPPKEKVVSIRTWWTYAAAVVVLLLVAGAWLWLRPVLTSAPQVAAAEVLPGFNRATLTLADGSRLTLDSAGDRILQQGNASVRQNGGTLTYREDNKTSAVSYNTLTIPRGGQFQLTLADGTEVWLNAASSIRYPTTFNGKERLVEITGEAYFEVAKNARQPFRVKIDKRAAVEVLGTHFNVNAYVDEAVIRTTLLQGSVRVSNTTHNVVLQPGQQSVDGQSSQISVTRDADVEKVMAWKNGLFNFENARLDEVMRQIARWYDVEVVYEKGIPNIYFAGELSRNIKLSGVLHALQDSKVHFRLEGKKLIVLP